MKLESYFRFSPEKAEKLDTSKQAIASRDLYEKCDAHVFLKIVVKTIV